jgi:hypothetical protein
MARNPIFTHVHTISRGMFNASFQEYVTGLIAPPAPATDRPIRGSETSR